MDHARAARVEGRPEGSRGRSVDLRGHRHVHYGSCEAGRDACVGRRGLAAGRAQLVPNRVDTVHLTDVRTQLDNHWNTIWEVMYHSWN